jgi:hypothetical protein
MATYAELSESLPEHEREHVMSLANDVLFMRHKLAETRRALESQPVVIPYDNGGGQSGIRANPAFAEYEKLLKSYTQAYDALKDALGNAGKVKPVQVSAVAGRSKWKARANG